MITLQVTIQIDRPVKEVYDYVVNVENTQKWQPAVIQVKRLTEGPIRVGTRFSEVAKILGRQVNTTCEVTHLVPNKVFAFKGTSDGPLEYQTAYTFEQSSNGTRVNIVGSFRTKGLWRLLEPILKGEVERDSRRELSRMKAFIEARTP
jgi:uncharacterized membrane protein